MTKARDLASASTALSAVSATELAFVDGVTSAIQTQIDAKAPSSTAVTLTGTQTLTNKTLTSPVIASVVNNTLTSTTGDMIYASAANTPARLGIGSSAQVLTVAGGIPSWATPASSSNLGLKTIVAKTSFSSVSTLNIDNIFSSTYQNYRIMFFGTSSAQIDLRMSFRSGGTPNTTASNYRDQNFLYGSDGGNIFTPNNGTNDFFVIGRGISTFNWSIMLDVLSPFATAGTNLSSRSSYQGGTNVAYHASQGGCLTVTTSYDGIGLFTSSGTITGNYIVYGYGETV